ncbi:MAG: EamA family transporter, partial [Candidatus Micrarchaeota archaeon]
MGEEKGILFAFATALISGISVFVSGSAVNSLDPFAFTFLKNAAAATFLGAALLFMHQRKIFAGFGVRQLKWLLLIGIIGGGIP